MKKIIFLIFSWTTFIYSSFSVQEIHKMILEIHEKRDGIKLELLDKIVEPFVATKMEKNQSQKVFKKSEKILVLHAILNNKAFINNAWFKLNEPVSGYFLKYIGRRGVVLRNGNHIKKLLLHKRKENYFSIEEKE